MEWNGWVSHVLFRVALFGLIACLRVAGPMTLRGAAGRNSANEDAIDK